MTHGIGFTRTYWDVPFNNYNYSYVCDAVDHYGYSTFTYDRLGIGVGGDYPMSASVTSDRANLRKRGTLLAYIFSNQGWGSFVGGLATMVVLACYKHVMNDEGKTSKVDGGTFYLLIFVIPVRPC